MIYGCKRTSNIMSLNYNTFAYMKPILFMRLIQQYPEYEKGLIEYVTTQYKDDDRLKLLIQMVKRVEYFDKADDDILYEIVFNLEIKQHQKDDMILGDKDDIDSIYFMEEGIVQVSSEFEKNEFIIDMLGPGSIINQRAVFLGEQMQVSIKALTDCKILSLSLKKLLELVAKHGEIQGKDNKKE